MQAARPGLAQGVRWLEPRVLRAATAASAAAALLQARYGDLR